MKSIGSTGLAYLWGKIKSIIPTKVSDLTNDSGFTSNVGTITGITMNGTSKGTSGAVNLGTVLTEHQDISGKADSTDVYTKTQVDDKITVLAEISPEVSDLDFADEDGNVLTRFSDGHIKTKNFDSSTAVVSTSIRNVIKLTNAEYTALVTKDSSTLYIITS